MTKTYTGRDVGVDCDWKTSGATEDEVMASIGEHAAQAHPEIDLTPELVATSWINGVGDSGGPGVELSNLFPSVTGTGDGNCHRQIS